MNIWTAVSELILQWKPNFNLIANKFIRSRKGLKHRVQFRRESAKVQAKNRTRQRSEAADAAFVVTDNDLDQRD